MSNVTELQASLIEALTELSEDSLAAAQDTINEEIEKVKSKTAAIIDAAGTAGVESLAAHFITYRDSERRLATRYQVAFITLFAITSLIASAAALRLFGFDLTVRAEVSRLALAIPWFVLSYFLARRSTEHRHNARTSQDIAVRLQSLEAFLSGLDDDSANEVKRRFGAELFSVPQTALQADTAEMQTLAETVLALAQKVPGIGSAASTGKR